MQQTEKLHSAENCHLAELPKDLMTRITILPSQKTRNAPAMPRTIGRAAVTQVVRSVLICVIAVLTAVVSTIAEPSAKVTADARAEPQRARNFFIVKNHLEGDEDSRAPYLASDTCDIFDLSHRNRWKNKYCRKEKAEKPATKNSKK